MESITNQIAARIKALRATRGLNIEALAARSGVSKSMISAIERGQSSPTAAVLDRLAAGLAVPLASLFDAPSPNAPPLARHADQPTWRDPATGYIRRNVSPAGASPIQIVEIAFPAAATVTYDTAARNIIQHQQIWVLAGHIEVSVGDETHRLGPGDCLSFVLDRPTRFHNPTRTASRYAVVIVAEP